MTAADECFEVCVDGYAEHDERFFDEADGITVYICTRCGAELISGDDE